MSSLNKILLIGKVSGTPDLKLTTMGDSRAQFTVAVERPDRGDGLAKQIDLLPIVAWRQVADQTQQLAQDAWVLIEGRIHTRTYEDPEKGKQYITEVEARSIQALGEGSSHISSEAAFAQAAVAQTPNPKVKPKVDTPQVDEKEFDFGDDVFRDEAQLPGGFSAGEEEIPF